MPRTSPRSSRAVRRQDGAVENPLKNRRQIPQTRPRLNTRPTLVGTRPSIRANRTLLLPLGHQFPPSSLIHSSNFPLGTARTCSSGQQRRQSSSGGSTRCTTQPALDGTKITTSFRPPLSKEIAHHLYFLRYSLQYRFQVMIDRNTPCRCLSQCGRPPARHHLLRMPRKSRLTRRHQQGRAKFRIRVRAQIPLMPPILMALISTIHHPTTLV